MTSKINKFYLYIDNYDDGFVDHQEDNIWIWNNQTRQNIDNDIIPIVGSIGKIINQQQKNINIEFNIIFNYRKYEDELHYLNETEIIIKKIFYGYVNNNVNNNVNNDMNNNTNNMNNNVNNNINNNVNNKNINIMINLKMYKNTLIRGEDVKIIHFKISYKLNKFIANAKYHYFRMLNILTNNQIRYGDTIDQNPQTIRIKKLKDNKLHFDVKYKPCNSNTHNLYYDIDCVLDLKNNSELKLSKIIVDYGIFMYHNPKNFIINFNKTNINLDIQKLEYYDKFNCDCVSIIIHIKNNVRFSFRLNPKLGKHSKIIINTNLLNNTKIKQLYLDKYKVYFIYENNDRIKLPVYFKHNEKLIKYNKCSMSYNISYNNGNNDNLIETLKYIKYIKYREKILTKIIYILLINGISFELIHIYMKYFYY